MTAFFICIILIGILIAGIAMVWMVIEKKNMRDYRLDLDERRHDLERVIEDAEQLLNELNDFSDYVVNNLENKQQSLETAVRTLDERLELLSQLKDIDPEVSGGETFSPVSEQNFNDLGTEAPDIQPVKKGKVIPLDVKKREVIKLYKSGMDSTEIAKMLNMGKGEIELISRMSK